MNQSKTILITTVAASVLVLAGCSPQTATSTNVNVANDNATVEVVDTTNGNININGEAREVGTSDWLTYTNEEYGFSFKYPSDYSISTNDANTVMIEDNESLMDGKLVIERSDSFLKMTEQEILSIEPGKEVMPLLSESFLTVNTIPSYKSLRQLKKGELLYPSAQNSTERTEQTWTEIEYRYLDNNNLIRLTFNIQGENYQNFYEIVDAIGKSFSI